MFSVILKKLAAQNNMKYHLIVPIGQESGNILPEPYCGENRETAKSGISSDTWSLHAGGKMHIALSNSCTKVPLFFLFRDTSND